MSYYPLLNLPSIGLTGWVTLSNFSPNNFERIAEVKRYVYLSWIDNDAWHHRQLGIIPYAEMLTFAHADIASFIPAGAFPLLSLSEKKLPAITWLLPVKPGQRTQLPAWRATIGLRSELGSASYQGEIDPFPPKASLLSVAPFLQISSGVHNALILLNAEAKPQKRKGCLSMFDAYHKKYRGSVDILSNHINVINLDGYGYGGDDLPIMLCPEMAGIPLYLSCNEDQSQMSLEHSHPPSCTAILGERWKAQSALKKYWFSQLTEMGS